jgi:hypothetical protein
MTPDVPIARLRDDSGSHKIHAPGFETIEQHRSWALDDVEGVVMGVLDDLVIGSAGQAMEKVATRRLFGYVAAWGVDILQEVLGSAVAPSGDVGVDSNEPGALSDSRGLLGRRELPPETLDPPKKCRVDESYLRRQVPIRAVKRDHYESEGLHHAVKAASRSHAHPASITSSRLTMKSKMRKKQHGAMPTSSELPGPQPGVPYSTEPHESLRPGRHHMVSPRKAIATHHPAATASQPDSALAPWDPHFHSISNAALQLHIDTDSVHQAHSLSSARSRRSPPPLSRSPSSAASSRRKPHPPGSAQRGRDTKPLCFGEKEEEVKVEYAVQKSPPRRSSVSLKGALPDIDSRRVTPRPSLAFGDFGGVSDNDEDPLDQHFHVMPLSPGVRVQAGEEANAGPDLPLFSSRMRRSTFVALPSSTSVPVAPGAAAQPNQSQQPRKGTFLTETAWDLGVPPATRSSSGDQVSAHQQGYPLASSNWPKSEDVSYAEPTDACSCSSSTSLVRGSEHRAQLMHRAHSTVITQTLFRRQGKVQRPCRSCSNPNAEPARSNAMNFTNLVKQRAFHLKPPCLPTSSSPSKHAPGASPRRVTSAPASSRTCTPV